MSMTKDEIIEDVKSQYKKQFLYHRDRENALFDSGMNEYERAIHEKLMFLAEKVVDLYDGYSNGPATEYMERYVETRRLL